MDSSNNSSSAQIEENYFPGDNFEKQFNGITDSEGKLSIPGQLARKVMLALLT